MLGSLNRSNVHQAHYKPALNRKASSVDGLPWDQLRDVQPLDPAPLVTPPVLLLRMLDSASHQSHPLLLYLR